MFNTTHTLVGITLARLGLDRTTPWATAAAAVAANLPDVDFLMVVYGPAVYLASHRGFTHSLPGILLLSFGFAIALYLVNLGWIRWTGTAAAPVKFKPLLAVALISMLTHPLLDYTNAYGIRCFLPFSARWYAWDIVFVISPYLDAGLLISILLSMWRRNHRRHFAAAALVFVVAFWGLCAFSHRRALRVLTASSVNGETPVAMGAFPLPLNLFQWDAVVETPVALHKLRISSWNSPGDLRPATTIAKPQPHPAIERSRQAYSVKVFLDFARFPVARVTHTLQGYTVTWVDLRFYSVNLHEGFTATVMLSPALEILSDGFDFNGRIVFD